ncbi:aldehyde dehydrogenase [Pseudomonas sp. 2FG]|uniref:aldehyde dehydrogenase n=1 Tax=Pseudomonas sp. 2FG TaxID=2502191 RepID=UPI0010F8DB68|nr:aldehyde dehydrogenase [Pseudomonas sp. 2FG]
MTDTRDTWAARAATLNIEGRAFIAGEYCQAADAALFACHSPLDNRLLQQVTRCSAEEVERAVGSARRSFNSGAWAQATARERKAVLLRWAALIEAHNDELALLETLDAGKPITDTCEGDIPAVVYCLQWFAEAIDKLHDELIPSERDFLGMVSREPIGVVAAIVPWNYPLLMAAWKFAPALAAGNSLILKPSEKSPLTAIRVAELGRQAGLPAGVFQVLPGFGDVGQRLAEHPDVDCLAFTGSGPTGRRILHAAADSNLKRVWLELGGKSPNIVLADCPDLPRAAKAAAAAIYSNMGEVCSAGSRLLVQRGIQAELSALIRAELADYQPGDPLDPATRMGALIDQGQLQRVLQFVDSGRDEAELLGGGQVARASSGGFYLEPTLFACADQRPRIAREEIFGPVLSIIPFDEPDEAVSLANTSEFGLAAAVWSADFARAHELSRQLRAGTVWINCYDELADMNFPFGGYKQSGNGRDNSLHALEKYSELKTTIARLR